MKIWLDDERDPSSPYWQRKNAESDMVWVKTPEEAIELLKSGKVTFISFDHDLGTKLTGYDVAKFIEQEAFRGIIPMLKWAVHTDNPVGRIKIAQALKNADVFWQQQIST